MLPERAYGTLNQDMRATIWKESHVPLLYDWISSRRLLWPSVAVHWGHRIQPELQGSRGGSNSVPTFDSWGLYLSERTGDAQEPNTLLYFDVRVTLEHVSKTEDVAKPWVADTPSNSKSDKWPSEFYLRNRIVHPGEVNKIQSVYNGVVVTHTDSPDLYVWDVLRQKHRKPGDTKPNNPNCVLTGHKKNAYWAMSVARRATGSQPAPQTESTLVTEDPWIASGGTDARICVWRVQDYQTCGTDIPPFAAFGSGQSSGDVALGHVSSVEDVSFSAKDRNILCSAGQDSKLLIWDVRVHDGRAIAGVSQAHDGDINSCDFGGLESNLIATGGNDACIRVWDRRKLVDTTGKGIPRSEYKEHTEMVTAVMWNPNVPNVLASCSYDGDVLVWDTAASLRSDAASVSTSPTLLFRHVGHKAVGSKQYVSDIDWLPDSEDPWCIATVSETRDDNAEPSSTLQMWRISSLIYTPQEVATTELQKLQAS